MELSLVLSETFVKGAMMKNGRSVHLLREHGATIKVEPVSRPHAGKLSKWAR